MRARIFSAALGMALAFAVSRDAAAKDCAAELGGTGQKVEVLEPLSEAERVALSTLVYETLRALPKGHRPESLIDDAPPCPLGSFKAGDMTLTLFGGAAPFPLRWAGYPGKTAMFYLVAGPPGGELRRWGVKTAPYLLVAAYDRTRMVVSVFDDAPSDATLKDAIADSMRDPEFTPLAEFDGEGDAVTLFRETRSGIGAQLFGPAPSGERTATIGLPDGRYFAPGPSGQAVMREADLPCPFELGKLTTRQLVVVDGSTKGLDLACQYRDDDVVVSIFVERLPDAALERAFKARKAGMMNDYKNPKDTPQLVGVNGPTRFAHGASWLGDDEQAGGIWMARKGEFVIEVDATWKLDAYRDARDAIQRIDRIFFP
jgi:hypothetical protein